MFAFQLECEVVCQMPTLVIASQEPEGIRVPNLKGPEIQDTLGPG